MTAPSPLRTQFFDPLTDEGESKLKAFAAALCGGQVPPDIDLLMDPGFFLAARALIERKDRRVQYALMSDAAGPVAMLPIEIGSERNLPGVYVSLFRHPARLTGVGVICADERLEDALAALFEAVQANWPDVVGVSLTDLDTASPLYRAICKVQSSGPRLEREARSLLYLDLRDYPTIDAYYDSRSRHYKKNFRSGRNRLNKMGGYTFSTDGPNGPWQFDDMRRIDEKTWRARDKEGDIPRLMLEMCKTMSALAATPSESQLYALSFEGQPISMYYSLIRSNVQYVFKNTFDPEFSNVSPSVVAFHHVVETAIDAGVERMELMAGNEYARPWATHERVLSNDVLFFRTIKGRAAHLAATGARKMRDIVRKPATDPNRG